MSSTVDVLATGRKASDAKKIKNLRYWMLGWLIFAGVLNYMDRSSVSIAAPHMIAELGLTKTDIGLMGTVFSWTYAFCQLPAGYLIDKLGSKKMYFFALTLWSISTALMSLGRNMTQFLSFRFLLGVGESPNSPNCSKITTAWFPHEERGQASGIWDSGSKWGSALAPPVLTVLSLAFGWRFMFVIIGIAGVLGTLTVLIYRLGVWRQEMENTKHNIGAEVKAYHDESTVNFERLERRLDAIDHMVSLAADFRSVANRRQIRIDRRLERLEQFHEEPAE